MHKQKTFEMVNGEGKQVSVKARRFTFAVESVIVKRFSKEAIDGVLNGKNIDLAVTPEMVLEDMPNLLELTPDINLTEQDLNIYYEVYLFFIFYKLNAVLNQLANINDSVSSLLRAKAQSLEPLSI